MNDINKELFQSFLEDFCRYHHGEVSAEGPLPMRFLTNSLTVKEVEAEVIDWTLQYLTSKCPRYLGAHIARKITEHVLSLDLSNFLESKDRDPSEEEEETTFDQTKDTDGNKKADKSQRELDVTLDENTVLSISALAPVVFTKIHSLCDQWDRELPDDVVASTILGASPVKDVSVYAIKNTRRKMEDKHVVHLHLRQLYNQASLEQQTLTFLSVFDGHGGQHGSNYAATHFHDNLVKAPELKASVSEALKETFLRTDEGFCQKAERESLGSGTTGVCAVIVNDMLHVGWLGDSEGLLVKDGKPVKLVTPHKPERQDEQNRIKALGGFVEYRDGIYRVNGVISVARAIGDRNLKPYLCANAEVTSVPLDGTEDYIVLGCDGLWDVVSHEEVVEHVYQHIEECDGDRSGVAQMLVNYAKEQGSEDNITVVVAFLREKTSPPKSAKEQEAQGVAESLDDAEKNDKGSEKSSEKTSSNGKNENPVTAIISDSSKGSGSSDSFEPDAKQAGSGTLNSQEVSSDVEMSLDEHPKGQAEVTPVKDSLESGDQETLSSPQEGPSRSSEKGAVDPDKKSVSIKSSSKTKSHHSGNPSGSSGDLVLLAQAAKCVNNRRGRRSRNGRRRNNHRDARRPSKESQTTAGMAYKCGSVSRMRSSSESKVVSDKGSIVGTHAAGENVFHLLTGCNPNVIHRSRSQSRWTVAVELEIESASAMFEELIPITEVSGKRSLSKKIK